MDQLETQVSDLRSFLGSAAATATATGAPQGGLDAAAASPHDVAGSLYGSSGPGPGPGRSGGGHPRRGPEGAGGAPSPSNGNVGLSTSTGAGAGAGIGAPAGGPLHTSSHHSSFSAPGDNSAHHHQSHHNPQSPLDNATVSSGSSVHAKRRAEDFDDGQAKQQRSKRNRYISIACNECKRRKIKCNGQTPCQRCGHLNLQCLYAPNCCSNFKDSDEFKQMSDHVQELQKHVESLYSSLNSLRQETARLAPLHERPLLPPPSAVSTPSPSASSAHRPPPHLPFRVPSFFSGPTSLAFTVDVAKDTLHKMGYSGVGDGHEDHGAQPDPTPHASPQMTNAPPGNAPPPSQGPADPLWEFDESEMIRLIRVYQEEVDVMYPVTAMGPVMAHARCIASWMDAARRPGGLPSPGLEQVLQDHKTLVVKILMCCALVVTEHGNSDKAVRIYDSLQPLVDKMLMSTSADVSQLAFLALCSGYRFLSNDEVLAWRLVGQVARHCFELGLHRREGIQKIADPQIRRDALHTFWSVYVLDRRWSFSTGLPFVCHDDKIDPKLPYPEGYPFLMAMIGYSRVAAKIWRLVDYFEPAVVRELKPHDFEQLDREIMEWYDSVPEEVRAGPLDGDQMSLPSGPYDLQRLRIWTRLRLNQVRIWLYTPVLHSATSISQNAQLARKVVDLAKQTIRILTHLNNETDQYRRIQVFYHQFLTSSIGVLFLASTHAPLQFSAVCRDEFYMALDLVKGLSSRSWVSHRLWRTIRSLQAYAPKLGLSDNSNRAPTSGSRSPYARASSSAAGHRSPALPRPFDNGPPSRPGSVGPAAMHSPVVMTPVTTQPMHTGEVLSNGLQLQNEMSQIFEGYIGMTSKGQSSGNELGPMHRADMGYGGMGLSPMRSSGSEEPTNAQGSVYQYVKDIF